LIKGIGAAAVTIPGLENHETWGTCGFASFRLYLLH
jgi:hypothetical protein